MRKETLHTINIKIYFWNRLCYVWLPVQGSSVVSRPRPSSQINRSVKARHITKDDTGAPEAAFIGTIKTFEDKQAANKSTLDLWKYHTQVSVQDDTICCCQLFDLFQIRTRKKCLLFIKSRQHVPWFDSMSLTAAFDRLNSLSVGLSKR